MPHDAHFLERLDRIPRSQIDFALSLYRDAEMVQWILRYAGIEPDDGRVALALEDGGQGPHVIVTHDGHFVTTLGKGMSTGPHRVLSRGQIDAYVAKTEDARRRLEISGTLVPSGKAKHDILHLTVTRPDAISREELGAILGWQPLINSHLLIETFQTAAALEAVEKNLVPQLDRPSARTTTKLEESLLHAHRLGVLFTLATAGEMPWVDYLAESYADGDVGVTYPATSQRLMATALRGAWAGARLGRAMLPSYKRLFTSATMPSIGLFDAILGVTAIGLRHARAHGDAKRILEAAQASPTARGDDWAPGYIAHALHVLDAPETALTAAIDHGRRRYAALSRALPEGSPDRFENEADVPRELALVALANSDEDSVLRVTLSALAWVARVQSPEELHFPGSIAGATRLVSRRALALERMQRVRTDWQCSSGPVKRAPAPGRNEPCGCGSGKKYKKCCGK